MLQTAIRRRWLTDDLKDMALGAIRRGLECGDERAEQTAVRNLLMMEAQNQGDEHKAVDVQIALEHDRLDGIAADLGIDPGALEAIAREADGSTGRIEEQGEPVERNGPGQGRNEEAREA